MPRLFMLSLLGLAGGCSVLFEPAPARGDGGIEQSDGAAAVECPPGYEPALGSCYRASSVPRTAVLAGAACQQDGPEPGAHLVVIESSEENTVVNDYFGGEETWIGLVRPPTGESFLWVTGEQLDAQRAHWQPDEPSNNDDRCVVIQNDTEDEVAYTAVWDNKPCVDDQAYVCEYDGKAALIDVP